MKTELMKTQIELQDAVDFLAFHFRLIFRKDGFPGLIHPLQVTQRIHRWGITFEKYPQTYKKALFHDIPEDCTFLQLQDCLDLIRQKYGDEIADGVAMLTMRPKGENESSADYQLYKQTVLASYVDKPIDVMLIKLADRICNVWDFLDSNPNYAPKYFHYADALFAAVRSRKQEIVDMFGENVLKRIMSDIHQLETIIQTFERN